MDTQSRAFLLTKVHSVECIAAPWGFPVLMQITRGQIMYFGFENQRRRNGFPHDCPLPLTSGVLCFNETSEMEPFGNTNGNVLPLCALPRLLPLLPWPHITPFLLKSAQMLQVYVTVLDIGYGFHKSRVFGALLYKVFSARSSSLTVQLHRASHNSPLIDVKKTTLKIKMRNSWLKKICVWSLEIRSSPQCSTS